MTAAPLSKHYENTPAAYVMGAVRAMDGVQKLNPDICAQRILEAVVDAGGSGGLAGERDGESFEIAAWEGVFGAI